MPTGYPDFRKNIDIAQQSLSQLNVNLIAQAIANLTVDIAAQSVGNMAINVAGQTLTELIQRQKYGTFIFSGYSSNFAALSAGNHFEVIGKGCLYTASHHIVASGPIPNDLLYLTIDGGGFGAPSLSELISENIGDTARTVGGLTKYNKRDYTYSIIRNLDMTFESSYVEYFEELDDYNVTIHSYIGYALI